MLNPFTPDLFVRLVILIAGAADGPAAALPAGESFSRIQEAVAAFKDGKWQACIDQVRPVAEGDPTSAVAAYYMAACYSHLKDEKQAAAWLERTFDARHPQGTYLAKDRDLAWVVGTEAGQAVIRRREERVQARFAGVLRHQRFAFSLPYLEDPRRKLASGDLRGKAVAVLLIERYEDKEAVNAAIALQALRAELAPRGFETVALHLVKGLETAPRKLAAERFLKRTGWGGVSLTGTPRDLFPLEVSEFPAVVFLDATGVPRFIEERFTMAQRDRYRERVGLLLGEAERAKAGAVPGGPAAEGTGAAPPAPGAAPKADGDRPAGKTDR